MSEEFERELAEDWDAFAEMLDEAIEDAGRIEIGVEDKMEFEEGE